MSDAPKRINVDREEDWLRVKENVEQAGKAVMAEKLAGIQNAKLRKEVESRLGKLLEDTFAMSKRNLTINGHDYEDYVEVTESFDYALDNRMYALASELEGLQTMTTDMRFRLGDLGQVEDYLEAQRANTEWLPDEPVSEQEPTMTEAPAANSRREETIETYSKTLDNLKEVIKTAPTQVNRAERAKAVKEQISSLRS